MRCSPDDLVARTFSQEGQKVVRKPPRSPAAGCNRNRSGRSAGTFPSGRTSALGTGAWLSSDAAWGASGGAREASSSRSSVSPRLSAPASARSPRQPRSRPRRSVGGNRFLNRFLTAINRIGSEELRNEWDRVWNVAFFFYGTPASAFPAKCGQDAILEIRSHPLHYQPEPRHGCA